MGFLDDGLVPDGKIYVHPLAATANPDMYVSDAEWNTVMANLQALRLGLYAADQIAFTPSASIPTARGAGGQAYRLWVKTSDKTLHYWDGSADHDVTAGGGGSAVVTKQRYTATGSEGTDFMVTLSSAQPVDTYAVVPQQVKGAAAVFIECPDDAGGDRTTTQFRVLLSSGLSAGDKVDFIVIR